MEKKIISLEWHEILMAATIGVNRHIESRRRGLNNAHGYSGQDQWDIDIEGAACEMVFAKAIKVFWDGSINTFKAADVGPNIQIRGTREHTNKLLVRPGDSDTDYFVLITGRSPEYHIRGFLQGKAAKQRIWLRDEADRGKPAYFVPQDQLLCPTLLGIEV